MNVDDHQEPQWDDASSRRYNLVAAPRPSEGISNALRAAFDPVADPVPSEFNRLLLRLN